MLAPMVLIAQPCHHRGEGVKRRVLAPASTWWRKFGKEHVCSICFLLFGLLTTIALLVASTIAVRVFRGLHLIVVEAGTLSKRARRDVVAAVAAGVVGEAYKPFNAVMPYVIRVV